MMVVVYNATMTNIADITADAVALQERDEFRSAGWLKLIAPAKVNLHLAIGARRDDGYHEAVSIMHAINLHDVVYARRIAGTDGTASTSAADGAGGSIVRMVPCGDVEAPDVAPQDNIAMRALRELGVGGIELRIEKNIPAQAGLGGGSADAAAALVAAAALSGMSPSDPAIEKAARKLGADVAFFLHGGCTALVGAGDEFARSLEPMKRSVALVKPAGGVSTAAAYRTFDESPSPIPDSIAENAAAVQRAEDIELFNNLAPASEQLMPELAEVRSWASEQSGVEGVLLCGSGAATFAVCSDFAAACAVVAGARKRGWWARATSFGSARAMVVSGEGATPGAPGAPGAAAATCAPGSGAAR